MDTPPAQTVARLAPAKINLALHVTGRRDDGYHLIDSLAVFTRFGDRVTVSRRRRGRFCGQWVVRRAYSARWREPCAARPRCAAQRLSRQRLPAGRHRARKEPAGGLRHRRRFERRGGNIARAGGSVGASIDDAALARDRAFARRRPADVPCRAAADRARDRRRSRRYCRISRRSALVLVNPGVAVSTAAVFARWQDATTKGCRRCRWQLSTSIRCATGWRPPRNDLEPPALRYRAGHR